MVNVTSYHVTGDWRHIIDDGMVDLDALPDEALPTGFVVFTPLSPKVAVAGNPATAHTIGEVQTTISAGVLTDMQGRTGVWLAGEIGGLPVRWKAVTHLDYYGKKIPYPVIEFNLTEDIRLTGLLENHVPGEPPYVVDPRIELLVKEAQNTLDEANEALDSFGVTVGGTVTGAEGSNASVTVTGEGPAYELSFTIPKGDQGIEGPQGPPGEVTEAELSSALAGKADTTHTHTTTQITGLDAALAGKAASGAENTATWDGVSGKPSAFPTTIANVSGLSDALANAGSNDAGDLTGWLTESVNASNATLSLNGEPVGSVAGFAAMVFDHDENKMDKSAIQVVTALPSSPDPNVIYLIQE